MRAAVVVLVSWVAASGCGAPGARTDAPREWRFVADEGMARRVAALGAEVVAAAGRSPADFRFHVVADDRPNAFARPGGDVFVHRGAVLAAADASELAAVLAHEVGHVVLGHPLRRPRAGLLNRLAALAAGGPRADAGAQAEFAADRFALEALAQAGYDPGALASFLRRLDARGGARGFASSHPAFAERIARLAR